MVAVHAESTAATPPKLQQMVATCELDKKMETIWVGRCRLTLSNPR
jgi:ATP-dependent RNA helicase DDX10/DBP4